MGLCCDSHSPAGGDRVTMTITSTTRGWVMKIPGGLAGVCLSRGDTVRLGARLVGRFWLENTPAKRFSTDAMCESNRKVPPVAFLAPGKRAQMRRWRRRTSKLAHGYPLHAVRPHVRATLSLPIPRAFLLRLATLSANPAGDRIQ